MRVSGSNNFSKQSDAKPLTIVSLECFQNDNEKIKALMFKYNELLKHLIYLRKDHL